MGLVLASPRRRLLFSRCGSPEGGAGLSALFGRICTRHGRSGGAPSDLIQIHATKRSHCGRGGLAVGARGFRYLAFTSGAGEDPAPTPPSLPPGGHAGIMYHTLLAEYSDTDRNPTRDELAHQGHHDIPKALMAMCDTTDRGFLGRRP